ncbi:MAG: ABC transporter ATP-binding protein [Actinobacteria bacterium]|nr:ABC transporter ATP-binding protein [Actinomycetota bacterium]
MSASASAVPVLVARDLEVVRAGRTLAHVDALELLPGDVHVLLGANGAGKSTLLKALNGLEEARGTLEFEGREVTTAAARLVLRRRTAAVFQRPYLLATSVRRNVESGLRLRGAARAEARRRAEAALGLLGIAHLAERRPDRLSGGEAQRVSIARALAVDPAVLFLDEPLGALDPPTRRILVAELLDIFAHRAMAVVWVTHDRDEALAVGDRVSFLEQGRIVQTGSAVELFAHPASSSFADFLGLDAYLEGEIVNAADGSTWLRLASGAAIACREAADGPAVACLPPEDVVLFAGPPAEHSTSLRNVLPGMVKSVSPAGRLLHVVVAAESVDVAALVTRAAREELGLEVGGYVVAAFKASAVHPIARHERRLS